MERHLRGQRPDRGAIEAAHEFDPSVDRPATERMVVVKPILIGKMWRREVVIGASDDLLGPLERVVEQEPAVDPGVAALAVLDPALHPLDLVEQSGDARCHWIEWL